LGICSFAVLTLIGILSVSLRTNGESIANSQAANAASRILAVRRAAPTANLSTNLTGTGPNRILLPALNRPWNAASVSAYVADDGTVVPDAAGAAFYAAYRVGTNADTGASAAQVYLLLAWPPGAGERAPNRYEIATVVAW